MPKGRICIGMSALRLIILRSSRCPFRAAYLPIARQQPTEPRLFFKAQSKLFSDPMKRETSSFRSSCSSMYIVNLSALLVNLSMPRSVGSSLASTWSLKRSSPASVRRNRASSAGFRGIFAASSGVITTRLSLGGISTRYEGMGGSGVGRVVCRGTVKKPPQNAPQKSWSKIRI